MNCPNCGKSLPPDSQFCHFCGNKVPETVQVPEPPQPRQLFCRKCGKPLPLNSKFCHFCGCDVQPAAQTPEYQEDNHLDSPACGKPTEQIPSQGTTSQTNLASRSSHQSIPAQSTASASAASHHKKKTFLIGIVIFLLLAVFIVAMQSDISATRPPENMQTPPGNGEFLLGSGDPNGEEIHVTAPENEGCVVTLTATDSASADKISFYVEAHRSVYVGIPPGFYEISFESGKYWLGDNEHFGEYGRRITDDEIRNFTDFSWNYLVYSGPTGSLDFHCNKYGYQDASAR